MTQPLQELVATLQKLKRLSDLELAKPGALTPGGFHARGRYTAALIEHEAPLLEAARRLVELESAMRWRTRHRWRVELPGEVEAFLSESRILGWPGVETGKGG